MKARVFKETVGSEHAGDIVSYWVYVVYDERTRSGGSGTRLTWREAWDAACEAMRPLR
jgi:hypothetical protein